MLRGEMPRLFDRSEPMQLGKARVLSQGDDITVLTSGIMTEEAMRAIQVLTETRTVDPAHAHLHLKAIQR